ncbi:Acid phosphatase [Rasamsonia emersonii CBS 393.64]|uniref:acid phosphatase n=1 Tax=Rasamsonia emersonii (strain ATCC 16479 / CBS 393.64 / IMI 116815) TaxID=1408163 RepID=A0A0F4YRD1_RASE3|nr:Acid phosphatase [Rasamsonia emersonii CBS 393.64]KKA20847.1 Acid phosphatase [Rasamsonia emersonii CBS 393.64]
MQSSIAVMLAAAGVAVAQVATTSEPALSQIQAAAATTLPYSPTSKVQGVAFDHFYQIWLENIDYSSAAGDPNQQYLALQGIELTNYWAIAHTSEPNYACAAGGDDFGMDNDNFWQIPQNVSTVVDLLETKGISWAEYQEHLPYPGFQGFNYSNQETYANDYVRKHDPLILYNSVTSNATRLRQIKNFTSLYDDIANNTLPQWAFITPNMTNDGHDTNITFASVWERGFIEKLRNYTDFWDNALILLTFDETEHYPIGNRVFSVLLGGAIPKELIGTKDDTFYTHFSSIASVSANWGLPSLGRWDCGANIFQLVANKTGYTNYQVDTTHLLLNESFSGPLSTNTYSIYSPVWPNPATNEKCSAGNGILQQVKETYANTTPTYNYTSPFPYDTKTGRDVNIPFSRNGTTFVSGVNDTSLTSTSSSPAASSSKSAAGVSNAPGTLAIVGGLLALVGSL